MGGGIGSAIETSEDWPQAIVSDSIEEIAQKHGKWFILNPLQQFYLRFLFV
jgi:hypothetical protein